MKIAFVSSEVFPFSKTGGLADVSSSLPKALASIGHEVIVFTPYYQCSSETIGSRGRDEGVVFSLSDDGVRFLFVKHDGYFHRPGIYGENNSDYWDNALRYSYFSKRVVTYLEEENIEPDIIHANDWQTGLLPYYLRCSSQRPEDRVQKKPKTLFTIHNLAYQGIFNRLLIYPLHISGSAFNADTMEFYGKLSFMKCGLSFSDHISTVSKKYASEILTEEYGCGLDSFLKSRKNVLSGIPNGVDYSYWSPENDRFIKRKYSINAVEKKIECKKDLLEVSALTADINSPIVGYVGRLAHQKGIDMILEIIDDIVLSGAILIILGSGEKDYEEKLEYYVSKYPDKIRFKKGFNEPLAHKIEAGSDIFVMPSRYEPCGLNQMYSLKYGTVPVVRATGGLDDTIIDATSDDENGTGFKFEANDALSFKDAIDRAFANYKNKKKWRKIIIRGMKQDFSWKKSAEKYIELYKKIQ